MHAIKDFLTNRFVLAYLAIYALFLVSLAVVEDFNLFLPLFVLLVMGVGFSLLALVSTRGIQPPRFKVTRPLRESLIIGAYLVLVPGTYLTFGTGLVRAVETEPLHLILVLVVKLLIFVVGPYALVRGLWGYRLKDLAELRLGRRHIKTIVWMVLLLLPFQLLVGGGLAEIRGAGLPMWQWIIGIPFAFVWLLIEVGLVEEFPYRLLLQSRLAACFGSEYGGIVVMALLFGLTHAPGLYREGHTIEAIGPSPSPLLAIGYSIVVISVAGLFLGTLWVRTRNLPLLMVVHATFDLIPNATKIVQGWLATR